MSAAVSLRNVVGEAKYIFVVAVVPLQRRIDVDVVIFVGNHDRLFDQRGLGAVKVADKGADAAFIVQFNAPGFHAAHVFQNNRDAGIQER